MSGIKSKATEDEFLIQHRKPGSQSRASVRWPGRMKCKDSKSEARSPSRFKAVAANPKQYLMIKIQMNQTTGVNDIANMILFLSLGHFLFEFVSHFDIRISNFVNELCVNHALWA
jgi:hypothetical protein